MAGSIITRPYSIPMRPWMDLAAPLRVLHLTDLHLRSWTAQLGHLQQRIAAIAPDLMVITGDFSDHPHEFCNVAAILRQLLGPIRPPLGTFGVLGNHDHPLLADEDLPLQLLDDEFTYLNWGAGQVALGGVTQHVSRRSPSSAAMSDLPDDVPLILLAHYPSTVWELPAGRGVVCLSGHTHGGQIRLPGLGCVFTNDRIPGELARGLHVVRGNWLHVSAGVGVSGPLRWRLFCPADMGLLDLVAADAVAPAQTGSFAQTDKCLTGPSG